jgi:putative ABC transport system permease protein
MYLLKLIRKNALRHKLRTGLTILSITIAILAFGLLRTVITAWYTGVEASSSSRMVVRNSVSMIFPLPLSYKEKIRQIEGVKIVSYGSWFGGIYIDQKNFFANFAIEPRTYLELYPEWLLSAGEREAFLRDRRGSIAGRRLAEKYKWKVGDIITLKGTIYPGNWEFVLRGIYRGKYESTDERAFLFHWDYLNESLKKTSPGRADQVGWYTIGLTNPNVASAVARRIDTTFANSLAETLTETEKSFVLGFISMSDAIITAIRFVSLVVIIIILAVVANTMTMTVRERTAEYAVFKTLGFGGRHLVGLIFGESLTIMMMGCAAGIVLTFPAARVFGKAVGTFFPTFHITTETVCLDIAASLMVGILAAIVPAYRSIRIPIAEGLRRAG